MAEDLRQRRAAFGISYNVLNTGVEAQIPQFAEVISLLSGQ